MKVNKVYAEEIAKMEGGEAARPFTVQWDVSESGADLKVGRGCEAVHRPMGCVGKRRGLEGRLSDA